MGVYLYSRLPSAYQEVEYIQSSGTQYINTGIYPNPNYTVKFKHQKTTNVAWNTIFGTRNGSYSRYLIRCNSDSSYFTVQRCISTSSSIETYESGSLYDMNIHEVEMNRYLYVDGSLLKTFSASTFTGTFPYTRYLFALNSSGSAADYGYYKMYYFKIYDTDNNLIRDFVPCYRKSDNVIGLYDLVNNQFYTNSGTGTFSKGADVTAIPLKNAYIGEYVETTWNGDLTKATLSSTTSISGFSCYAPCFSDDGMKFYYTIRNDGANGTIYEYDLGTAWDVSTKSGSATHTMTIGSGSPRYGVYVQNMLFRNNGQYMYVGYFNHPGSVQGYVAQYTLSTPYNISTATLTYSIGTGQYGPGVWVSEDGTEFWFMSDGAYYKQLSTPYMIETATKITSTRTIFRFISSDGKYAYNHPVSSTYTKQYSLGNGYDFSSWSEVASITQTGSNYCEGMTFNKDGTKLYVLWGPTNSGTVRTYTIS